VKSLSFKELDLVVGKIQSYSGAVLEDIVFNNDILLLLLKYAGRPVHFVIDLRAKPYLLASEQKAPSLKKQVKPIVLFLKAHFLGSVFDAAMVQKEFGRLVRLKFSENREMELHLFSQARNAIFRHDKSQISLHKVSLLQPLGEIKEDLTPRSPQQIFADWMENFSQSSPKIKPTHESEKNLNKTIAKKNQGLLDLEKKIQEISNSSWHSIAVWLKEHRTLEVPLEFEPYIHRQKDLAWNIEQAFTKSKQLKAKMAAVEERRKLLQKEIDDLKANPALFVPAKPSSKFEKSAIDGAKGRTKIINDQIRAYVGKSAEDNLKILRKSKAWHLWMHIKDFPGSHGIVAFDKSVSIPVEVLREVALWIIENSLSNKQRDSWRGVRCEVLYCECRFVTPIRGDKLGRVNYKNEKILSVTLP
jgi:hypothetical protein